MTVCIAMICESNTHPKIAFCSDRLVTDSNGLTYELGVPKLIPITPNCFAMMAGRGAESDQILKSAIEKIESNPEREEFPSINKIVDIIKEEHQKLREKSVDDEILKPRGLTLKEFYKNIKNFPDWLAITLDGEISNYDFGVHFLIFGFDIVENKVYPNLYSINSRGQEKILNSLGFGIIGIGDSMSLPEITRETYSPHNPLSDAIVRLYWSKKSAERIVSVGHKTTDLGVMEVVQNQQGVISVSTMKIDEDNPAISLKTNYNEYLKNMKDATEKIQKDINKILQLEFPIIPSKKEIKKKPT